MSSDEQYAETVGKRMTEFPIERRNLLRATGAGLLGTAGVGAAQTTGTQETSGGDLIWEFTQPSGSVRSSPTVADGTVYVGSYDDTLYAVDAATGTQEWAFDTSGSVGSSPTVVDGTVYFAIAKYQAGTLYAVDAATGEEEWAFTQPSRRVDSSPTVADGTVYVGANDNTLYAVDAATGSQEWAFTQPSYDVESSPTVVDGTVYVGSGDDTLYAVDAATGTQEWAFTQREMYSSPTVADGTVYVGSGYNLFGSGDGGLYAVDAATGSQEWAFTQPNGNVRSSPTVADGIVYVGSRDDTLYAVDAATGTQEWAFDTSDYVFSSPTVADGTVYVGSEDRTLYAVDAATGSQEWAFTQPSGHVDSSPTVADGIVYVGSRDNTLYAVDAGVEGSSEGSRVLLRTLGHHDKNVEQPPDPDPTGTVAGQVTDEAGDSLADATVEFVPTGADTPEQTTTTNDSGTYEVELPADTTYEVTASKSGYVSETAEVTVEQNTTQTVDFTLLGTGTVTGQVTDEAGDSLADATVEFVPTGADTPEKTTTTNDSGSYEIEVPAGKYEIVVDEMDFEPTSVPVSVSASETSTVDIELNSQDASIAISEIEVGPDALLAGADNDLVFAVGIEPDPGVGTDQVLVQRETNFVAESIQELGDGTLNTYLDSLGVGVSEQDINNPVQLFEDLLNLPSSQIYATVVSTDEIGLSAGGNRFTVETTASDGSSTTDDVFIPRYSQGDRLTLFGTTADGPLVNFNKTYFLFNHTIEFDNQLVPENLPVDSNITLLDVDFEYSPAGSLNLNTLEPTAKDKLAFGVNVFGVGIESQWGGEWGRNIDEYRYELERKSLWVAALLQKSIPVLTDMQIDFPDNPFVDEVGINLDGVPAGYLLFADIDPTDPDGASHAIDSQGAGVPVPQTREVNHYLTLTAHLGAEGIAEVYMDGKIHTASDIDVGGVFQPPLGTPLVHKGAEVCLDGGITVGPGPIGVDFEVSDLINEPCVSLGETREPPCWEVFDYELGCQEYPSAEGNSLRPGGRYDIETTGPYLSDSTGVKPPEDAVTPMTDTATVQRLTDRPERDASPTLASRGNKHVAAWEQHPEGEPAEHGRDIVITTRDSTGWSAPTTLTDETGVSYHGPELAVSGSDAAIAWTRYNLSSVDRLDAVDTMTRIELTQESSDGWESPVVIEDTDSWLDRNAAIEPLGDAWVVAWERTDPDDTTTQAIGYAIVDATGSVERSETISDSFDLDLATDDDEVILGYHDQTNNQIRRDVVTETDRTSDVIYDVTDGRSLRTLAVSGQATVWTVANQETATGFYATDGVVEELDFVTEKSPLRALTLQETAAGTVLADSRIPEGDVRTRSVTYHLRVNGGWRPEQRPATTDATKDVTIRAPAVAHTTDGKGLLTLLGAKVHDPDAVHDLFAVEQPLRPNYAITADTEQKTVAPGEEMTVSYTIENTGDLDGDAIGDDPVLVEARSQDTTLADQQESPLARGATATGELTFTVDATGTVDIVVGRELDLLDPAERRTTIEGSTPLLSVDSVTVERPDEGTAVGTIQLRNSGPVNAADFGIEVYAGDDTPLGEAQVDGPAAGERSSATVEFDPDELVTTGGEEVHIDPDENLPESHVTQRVSPVLLGQPDVTVADDIAYSETDSGAVATLKMTNAGPVSASTVTRAVRADATPEDGSFADEDLFGMVAVDLPAAIDGTAQTTDVTLTLEGAIYGDEVRFIIESDRPVAGAGVPVVYDRVGPFGSRVQPLPGYDSAPQDLDGDGLFEDVDGDGEFTIFDVQAFFTNFQSETVQSNPAAFNFTEEEDPEEVTIFDVQALFQKLS